MSTPRTLIIGLDGATLTLIVPLVRAGYLPALGRLMTQGVHGHVQAWPNMNSEAGWTSLVTGYNPGQHSIYHLAKHTQRKDRWRPVTAADRKKDPFWCLLSAGGAARGDHQRAPQLPSRPHQWSPIMGLDSHTLGGNV